MIAIENHNLFTGCEKTPEEISTIAPGTCAIKLDRSGVPT